ncbi:hypothetical protein [Clostridium phage XP41-N3]|nr:hypothetical protein [Clostridium phage XP41-N3]
MYNDKEVIIPISDFELGQLDASLVKPNCFNFCLEEEWLLRIDKEGITFNEDFKNKLSADEYAMKFIECLERMGMIKNENLY